MLLLTRGFPKTRGTVLGVPIIRAYGILGPILGPPILGNCHISYKGSYQHVRDYTN